MFNSVYHMDRPENEPCSTYKNGTPERRALMDEVERQAAQVIDIPMVIGGKEIFPEKTVTLAEPHRISNEIARVHLGGEKELKMAIEASQQAAVSWAQMPMGARTSVFRKAADLLSGKYRNKVLAATMLGQSKNMWEAEIDIAELCDFLRFNCWNLEEIARSQPGPTPGAVNRIEYRPLEGFVAALAPFNFTSISGNLASAPAVAGNVVVWKPSTTAALASYYFMQILQEAGLPAGVINFVPSRGSDFSKYVLTDPRLAGFHFTGSTDVFNLVWKEVGGHIDRYHTYPRLVGETGGKDFIFADASADTDALISGILRAGFSYAGQKCSAASRVYVPASIWEEVRGKLHEAMSLIHAGDIRDAGAFCNAVIDRASYDRVRGYIEYARESSDAEIIEGGECSDSEGYFIQPTVILAKDPHFRTMVEEIFGPVVTVWVYDDAKQDEALRLCDTSTKYGLTGAVYAKDRGAIEKISAALSQAAGNFYVNEKPTGAVVGQQPFGGARASGTNDKAGSWANMIRWLSLRSVKEVLTPDTEILMPHMIQNVTEADDSSLNLGGNDIAG